MYSLFFHSYLISKIDKKTHFFTSLPWTLTSHSHLQNKPFDGETTLLVHCTGWETNRSFSQYRRQNKPFLITVPEANRALPSNCTGDTHVFLSLNNILSIICISLTHIFLICFSASNNRAEFFNNKTFKFVTFNLGKFLSQTLNYSVFVFSSNYFFSNHNLFYHLENNGWFIAI